MDMKGVRADTDRFTVAIFENIYVIYKEISFWRFVIIGC